MDKVTAIEGIIIFALGYIAGGIFYVIDDVHEFFKERKKKKKNESVGSNE